MVSISSTFSLSLLLPSTTIYVQKESNRITIYFFKFVFGVHTTLVCIQSLCEFVNEYVNLKVYSMHHNKASNKQLLFVRFMFEYHLSKCYFGCVHLAYFERHCLPWRRKQLDHAQTNWANGRVGKRMRAIGNQSWLNSLPASIAVLLPVH